MRFDREKFYKNYRAQFSDLSQQQVNGLNFLLAEIEKDRHITRIDWAAYMLATTKLETAHTFMPVHEYGGRAYFIRRYGSQTKVGKRLGNDTPEEGAIYAGRGDVQLTGEDNYERAEIALRREYPQLIAEFEARTGKKFDLTVGDQPNDINDPNNAQDPQIAYAIMSFGMRTGMFTGRKLSDYFNTKKQDAFNARKIINGLDHAQMIADVFGKFDKILRNSIIINKELLAENVGGRIDELTTSAASSADSPVTTPQISATPSADDTVSAGSSQNSNPTEQPPIQNADAIVNVGSGAEAAVNQPDEPFYQYLPRITKEKILLGFGIVTTGAANVIGWAKELSTVAQIVLGIVFVAAVVGLIWIIAIHRKTLGTLILDAMQLKADKSKNTPILTTDAITDGQQIPFRQKI